MRILFVHQNFPGQFRSLVPALYSAGHEIIAISMRKERSLLGVRNIGYHTNRGNGKDTHPWLISTEAAVLRAQAVYDSVLKLSKQNWVPDVVLGHTGWGEMLYMRQAAPKARLMGFCELYYQSDGSGVGFDPEFPETPHTPQRLQTRNMHLTQSLLNCDVGITPTQWQANSFPRLLRHCLHVVHDGIETNRLIPDPSAWIRLSRDGLILRSDDEVVTFINRNLEPLRGYHQFMRALPEILARRPKAHVVIVGGDGVSYGAAPLGAKGYKEIFLAEVRSRIDMSRVHFVSRIPYITLLRLLQVSSAHVYLTAPFVLSWSMLEAMSLQAMVIASDTGPVQEVIEHERNGLLVNFFDPSQLADAVCDVLMHPNRYQSLREAARSTIIDRYDFHTRSLPQYQALIDPAR